jgi:hypothetical protein
MRIDAPDMPMIATAESPALFRSAPTEKLGRRFKVRLSTQMSCARFTRTGFKLQPDTEQPPRIVGSRF